MVQVNNNTPITLRVKFFKLGNLQYISHLDLVRTMMKVIVRAKLPLWYTEGFNPKPKITFAAPLSIGTESTCEFMDIRLTERISAEDAVLRLNANMAPLMQVTEAYYPERKLSELRWLGYRIAISTPGADEAMAERCRALFEEDDLTVAKKGKSGISDVNIKPMIKSTHVSLNDGNLVIDCVLSAESASFLNPENVVKLLRSRLGILTSENLLEESYTVMRNRAYLADMTEFR